MLNKELCFAPESIALKLPKSKIFDNAKIYNDDDSIQPQFDNFQIIEVAYCGFISDEYINIFRGKCDSIQVIISHPKLDEKVRNKQLTEIAETILNLTEHI